MRSFLAWCSLLQFAALPAIAAVTADDLPTPINAWGRTTTRVQQNDRKYEIKTDEAELSAFSRCRNDETMISGGCFLYPGRDQNTSGSATYLAGSGIMVQEWGPEWHCNYKNLHAGDSVRVQAYCLKDAP